MPEVVEHTAASAPGRSQLRSYVALALSLLRPSERPRCAALANTFRRPPRENSTARASRLLWFTTIVPLANKSLASWHDQMQNAKVTISSALSFAPSLEPHMMYVGEPDELSAWMVRHGVRVHHWPELSFMREGLDRYASCACPSGSTCDPKPHCRAGYFREFVLGAWAKLDVPHLIANLSASGALSNVDSAGSRRHGDLWLPELVLVTDLDILFVRDIRPEELRGPFPLAVGPSKSSTPTFLACASDQGGDGINTGVWVQNITGMLREWPALMHEARARHFEYGQHEQTLVNKHFNQGGGAARRGVAIPRLPATWNARANIRCRVAEEEQLASFCYQNKSHYNEIPGAIGGLRFFERQLPVCSDIRIWHFHGLKPQAVQCYLEAMKRHAPETDDASASMYEATSAHREAAVRECRAFDFGASCDECTLVKFAWMLTLRQSMLALSHTSTPVTHTQPP